jgi:hypothetical protein
MLILRLKNPSWRRPKSSLRPKLTRRWWRRFLIVLYAKEVNERGEQESA